MDDLCPAWVQTNGQAVGRVRRRSPRQQVTRFEANGGRRPIGRPWPDRRHRTGADAASAPVPAWWPGPVAPDQDLLTTVGAPAMVRNW